MPLYRVYKEVWVEPTRVYYDVEADSEDEAQDMADDEHATAEIHLEYDSKTVHIEVLDYGNCAECGKKLENDNYLIHHDDDEFEYFCEKCYYAMCGD